MVTQNALGVREQGPKPVDLAVICVFDDSQQRFVEVEPSSIPGLRFADKENGRTFAVSELERATGHGMLCQKAVHYTNIRTRGELANLLPSIYSQAYQSLRTCETGIVEVFGPIETVDERNENGMKFLDYYAIIPYLEYRMKRT